MKFKHVSRLGCLAAALLLVAATAQGAVTLDVTQSVGGDGMYPTTGGTIDVTVSMTASGSGSALSLTVVEGLPAGWSYNMMVTAPASGMLFIQPNADAINQLDYVWLTPPTFPASFTFRLNVPAGGSGDKEIVLSGSYNGGTADDTAFGPTATVVSPAPVMVLVPTVTGLTQAAAQAAITDLGLVAVLGTPENSETVPAGSVISQDPAAGASVVIGSNVTLVISLGPCMTTVPSVVGSTQAAATTTLNGVGLTVGGVTQEYSDTVAAGLVISQNPAASASVACNTAVAVVISQGPCMTTVPNVVGSTQAAAATALTGASLTLGTVIQQYSDTVAEGLVISQNPTSGASVGCNSAVALVVSKGACTTMIPDVVGLTQAAATADLLDATLTLGAVTTQYSDTVEAGLVISQTPGSGQEVSCNTAVALVVSLGSCTTTVPNVVGLTQAAATTALTDASLTLGTVTQDYSDTVAEGLVISQNPVATEIRPCSSAVAVVISRGPCLVTMPNVIGLSEATAVTAIEAVGLSVASTSYSYSDTVAADNVISQNPAADASVPCESQVALVISQGPEPNETCPDNTLFGQIPDPPTSAGYFVSDVGAAVAIYDNFDLGKPASGVADLHWWGYMLDAAGNACDRDPGTYSIRFYADSGDVPGDEVCGYDDVVPTVTELPYATWSGTPLYRFDVDLSIECDLTAGWVSIQGTGDMGCRFAWAVSSAGDDSAYMREVDATPGSVLYDMAFCLTAQTSIEVPDVAGLSQTDAAEALEDAGLTTGVVTEDYSDTVPAGQVISQDPAAGTMVSAGTAVDLVLSLGPCLVDVPDITGLPYDNAVAALADATLSIGGFTYEYSTTVPVDYIISQDPAAGTEVPCETTVDVVKSQGPCLATVPDAVGSAYADAAAAIEGAGLAIGEVTEVYNDQFAVGEVISQSPEANAEVTCGSAVNLEVSLGVCEVTMPNLVGMSLDDVALLMQSLGLYVAEILSEYSDTVPVDYVISQNPEVGAVLPCGTGITIVKSAGPCVTTVPDLTGANENVRTLALQLSNLTLGNVTEAYSADVAVGSVMGQNPAAGTEVSCQSPVDVVLSLGPCLVTVPDVVGMALQSAEGALVDAGLVLGQVSQLGSDTVPEGEVISQNPVAGGDVPCDSAVSLVVSSGPCNVAVPNVVGVPLLDAEASVVAANLLLGEVTYAQSEDVAEGYVISQNPAASEEVPCGSAVDLVVSLGACVATTPDLAGMAQADAQAALTSANLVLGQVSEAYSDTVPQGSVISQDPTAGAELACGSAVSLVVSLGPVPQVEVPNVVGVSQEAAEVTLLNATLQTAVDFACDNTVPAGVVISQSPVAGTMVTSNTVVTMLVSTGVCSVPDLVGDPAATAEEVLRNLGLTVGQVTYVYSDTVAAGGVVESYPPAGTGVEPGAAVDLVVSLGAACTVPDVVGMTQAAAEAALSAAGFPTTTVTSQPSETVAAGVVLSQDPAADAEVACGATVALTVSSGPASPDAPVNVQASDGTYADRVRITWDAASNVQSYKVYRSETADFADAVTLGSVWAPSHGFSDYTAEAAVPGDTMSCKGSTHTEYSYWVVARSATGVSVPGGPDTGYRGVDDLKSAVYEPVMPAKTLESGTQAVLPDGQLAIRLRSEEAIDAASVWGVVTSALGETDAVAWLPLDEDGLDGWVVYVSETPWVVGDVITMTAGASTTSGEAVGPLMYVFEVVEDDGAVKAALTEITGVESAEGGVGLVYEIGPDEAYAADQRVWLPVPAGVAVDAVALYYYHASAEAPGWYLADDVAGWLVAGSYEVAEVDGVGYIGFDVRHGGIVQLVVPVEVADQGAAAIPASGVLGDLLTLALAGMLLLGFGSRFSRANKGLDQ